MTENEIMNSIRDEIERNPFATSYKFSNTASNLLLRLSDFSGSRKLAFNALRNKNDKLQLRVNGLKLEIELLKIENLKYKKNQEEFRELKLKIKLLEMGERV